MNALQLNATIFDLAVNQDLVSTDVVQHLRKLMRTDQTLKHIDFNKIEKAADTIREAYFSSAPLAQAQMKLDAAEGMLRGDIQDAVLNLKLTNPRDVRDALTESEKIATNRLEAAIREVLDYLETAGLDVTALRSRFSELYPAADDDDDQPVTGVSMKE